MAQSLAQILVHIVFSTRNRQPWLSTAIAGELHAYIGGIVENQKGALLKAGSVADHIHILISHPRTVSPSDLVRDLKSGSSKWLKTKGREFAQFQWQNGYGMFSISPSHRPAVERYIAGQADHHCRTTFQDEFRQLLHKYGLQADEAHLWD